MSKRKIAECINVRINVGNFQHIELTKYAEEDIEFSSAEERIKMEDALRDDLVVSIIRSMKAIPEKLGKGVENAIEVEQAIQKAIPEWLEKNPIPNIANTAKKLSIKNSAEQQSEKDKQDKIIPSDLKTKNDSDSLLTKEDDVKDLFEKDEKVETVETVVEKQDCKLAEKEIQTVDVETTDDIFDEDLFDNK